jgi:hemin uptake protein HemP
MIEQSSTPSSPINVKPSEQPSFDARELLGKSSTAQILLDGQTYFLRLTRQDKLILTK